MKTQSTHQTRIILSSEDGFSFFDINKILRCEGEAEITRIYFIDESEPVSIKKPIGKIDEILSEQFFYRINFKNIINLNYFLKYSNSEGGYIVLTDRSHVSISSHNTYHLINKLKNIVRTC